MRVWMNPEIMRIRGVSPAEVYEAIAGQNVEVSAGSVGQAIDKDNKNAFQYTLIVKGRLETPEEFENIIVKADSDGNFLRIKDIATVVQGTGSYDFYSTLSGQPSAAIAIYQQPGSNSLNVAKAVKAKMEELSEDFPKGIKYNVTLDTTNVIEVSIHEVLITLLETTLLVIIVIFIFLQNFRAVIIPCIAIPVSLIGTLAVMALMGFSLNTLTLFGMILSVAIVVDDAIVVTENSTRLLDTGNYSAKEAVTKAMDEIIGPIVSIVLVMLAVFIPTTLVSGVSGQLFKQFALTIAASTVLSGFNSLTLTPALCALFLEKPKPVKFFFFKWFNKIFEHVQNAYDWIVEFFIRRTGVALLSYAIITAIAVFLFIKWPSTFIPEEDDGYFISMIQLPPAASLERTQDVCQKVNAILDTYPEVKSYIQIAGFSVMAGGAQTNGGTYFVVLKPWAERKGKEHTVFSIVDRFNEDVYGIQEAEIYAMVPPAIPGLGTTGGLQMQLEDTKSLGSTAMQQAVDALLAAYTTKPALTEMNSQYQANVPQYYLNIDRDRVQFMGLELDDVFTTLGYYMGATYVNDYVRYGHIYQVKIESDNRSQKYIEDVLKLSIPNSQGNPVPFSSFTTIEEILGQDQISRYNMYTTAAVSVDVKSGYSSSEAIQQMGELVDEELNGQFGYEWTSMAYQETQAGTSTVIIFGMAFIIVILVLAAKYESWMNPLASIMGIPVALLGALLGCLIMKTPISIYSEIGIVLLIALSAKNGILIVEYARDYHAAGKTIEESATEAGHVRLRPILMTSLAFVFGVMPLLFSTGAAANSRIALGGAVVFGMAINTIFATIYIPVFYAVTQKLQEKFRWKRAGGDTDNLVDDKDQV